MKTKRERFLTVAKKRTQRVLDALAALEKCAARGSYEYTAGEVEQTLNAIGARLARVEQAFAEEPGFEFGVEQGRGGAGVMGGDAEEPLCLHR